MKTKKLISVFLTATMIFCLSSCDYGNKTSTKSGYPVTINDIKFNQCPQKVVVLSDSIADIILAMGYEVNLVACSDECTQEDLSVLRRVGSVNNIDMNTIMSLSPDLVLADTNLPDQQIEQLNNSKIKFLSLTLAKSRTEFEELYTKIGSIFGGSKEGVAKAQKISNNILLTLDDISRIIPNSDVVVTTCYMYDENGHIATGDQFIDVMIEYVDAVNIAKNSTNNTMNINDIRISNPAYIFCSPGVKEKLKSNEALSNLTALKEDKVYEAEENLFRRQGKTIISAVAFMAEKMYPELASDRTILKNSDANKGIAGSSSLNNTSSSSPTSSAVSTSKTTGFAITKDTVLKSGDSGDDILKMQSRLDELNYMPTKPNGIFDEKTKRAVTDFQFLNNMLATGIANDKTLEILFSDKAIERKDPARNKN